jgi:hypothetical protein
MIGYVRYETKRTIDVSSSAWYLILGHLRLAVGQSNAQIPYTSAFETVFSLTAVIVQYVRVLLGTANINASFRGTGLIFTSWQL